MRTERAQRLARGRWARALGLVGIGLAGCKALAQPLDERRWQVEAFYTAAAIDNLLRLPDAAPSAGGLSRDDRQSTAGLSAGARLDLGRQRVRAEALLRDERFARNPRFDHQAHGLSVSLDAATAGSISGRLAASHRQSLAPFDGSDITAQATSPIDRVRDLQASARLGAGGLLSIGVHGAWQDLQTPAGASPALQLRQQRQRRGGLTVEASPRAGTRFALSWTGARTEHPSAGAAPGERISSSAVELQAELPTGGTHRLALLLGSGRSRHSMDPARDFEGLTGRLSADWRPTGKTQLAARWVQEHGQHRLDGGGLRKLDDTRLGRRWELQASHALSAALSLDGTLGFGQRELGRRLADDSLLQGEERSRLWRLGLRWSPAERWSLVCTHGRDSRTTVGALGSALHASITACQVGWRQD